MRSVSECMAGVNEPSRLLSEDARRRLSQMARILVAHAETVDARLSAVFQNLRYSAAQQKNLMAIGPLATARMLAGQRPMSRLLNHLDYNGRRLAKLNVSPASVDQFLSECDRLLDSILNGEFRPAREQLHLITRLALNRSFYEVREAEAQAFFGLHAAEAKAGGLEDLLQRFIRVLTRNFRAHAGRIVLLEEEPEAKLAQPLYIESGEPNEALIADLEMRGRCASYWSYPVRPAGRTAALIQFGFRVRYPWLPRELTLLEAAAVRCHEAIERTLLVRRLEERACELRRMAVETRNAEEEERRRIGRELHDEAGQSLLLLRLHLEMLERTAPASMAPRLAEARAIAERTVEEIRRMVAALSPAVLDRLGLTAALRQLVVRFRKAHPVKVHLQIPALAGRFARQTEEVIYRVVQECLQNIAKHSQASDVNLSLKVTDKSIRLSVSDNGSGFCPEAALSKPMSFGLAGMRERAALLGGALDVNSTPGKGATVVLKLPLAPGSPDQLACKDAGPNRYPESQAGRPACAGQGISSKSRNRAKIGPRLGVSG
jgi:signal transduction histidine kinase